MNMYIKIISGGIIAFILGGAAVFGYYKLPSTTGNNSADSLSNTSTNTSLDTPEPEDFLSMRPELESLPKEELSDTERDALIYMREEEKLARDVYTTLGSVWGIKIFSNIAQSEQTHTETLRALLVKYAVSDPVVSDTVGAFTNDTISSLYKDLVARGRGSATEALKVGALIEDLDIKDLQVRIAATDNEDIVLAYDNLQRGSRNHLRSFSSQLRSRGVEYVPTYITTAEYNEIIASSRETGSGTGSGGGQQRGWGR